MMVWDLLVHHSLLPEKGRAAEAPALGTSFYEGLPQTGTGGGSVVGASAGAVNPKTFRKWIWAFIRAIAELKEVVVSTLFFII